MSSQPEPNDMQVESEAASAAAAAGGNVGYDTGATAGTAGGVGKRKRILLDEEEEEEEEIEEDKANGQVEEEGEEEDEFEDGSMHQFNHGGDFDNNNYYDMDEFGGAGAEGEGGAGSRGGRLFLRDGGGGSSGDIDIALGLAAQAEEYEGHELLDTEGAGDGNRRRDGKEQIEPRKSGSKYTPKVEDENRPWASKISQERKVKAMPRISAAIQGFPPGIKPSQAFLHFVRAARDARIELEGNAAQGKADAAPSAVQE